MNKDPRFDDNGHYIPKVGNTLRDEFLQSISGEWPRLGEALFSSLTTDQLFEIVDAALSFARKSEKNAHANRIAEIDRQVEEICGPLTEQRGPWEKR